MGRPLRFHVNPLKPQILMVANNTTGVIKEVEKTISWRDAAIVSGVLTLASFCTVYLPGYPYEEICRDVGLFLYESVVYVGKEFFTLWVALAGLGKITERVRAKGKEEETSPGSDKTTSEG